MCSLDQDLRCRWVFHGQSGHSFHAGDIDSRQLLAESMVGHAQGMTVGRFFPERPGAQLFVGNRWGNYGTWTVFDSDGQKICDCQPDYLSQGGKPINWSGTGEELVCVTGEAYRSADYTYRGAAPKFQEVPLMLQPAYGLYDARGRLAVKLPEERKWSRTLMHLSFMPDVTGDGRDDIVFADGECVYVYTQDTPLQNCYRPHRPTSRRGGPLVSLPTLR